MGVNRRGFMGMLAAVVGLGKVPTVKRDDAPPIDGGMYAAPPEAEKVLRADGCWVATMPCYRNPAEGEWDSPVRHVVLDRAMSQGKTEQPG